MYQTDSLLRECRSLILHHCSEDRFYPLALPGVHLMRFGWTSLPLVALQASCAAIVLQGSKVLDLGDLCLEYAAGQYLIAPVDLPAISRITGATEEEPLLGVAIEIDIMEIQNLFLNIVPPPVDISRSSLQVLEADAGILECIARLLRLLDSKQDATVLAPLMRREILYRMATRGAGAQLLEVFRNGSPTNRVAKATAWLREHFSERCLVKNLARHAGMSVSSFHEHFRVVTGMTPLQYQKRLRLQRARQLLFLDALDIGEVCVRVGYESHSHFSRDYRLFFGRLPKEDLKDFSRVKYCLTEYTAAR